MENTELIYKIASDPATPKELLRYLLITNNITIDNFMGEGSVFREKHKYTLDQLLEIKKAILLNPNIAIDDFCSYLLTSSLEYIHLNPSIPLWVLEDHAALYPLTEHTSTFVLLLKYGYEFWNKVVPTWRDNLYVTMLILQTADNAVFLETLLDSYPNPEKVIQHAFDNMHLTSTLIDKYVKSIDLMRRVVLVNKNLPAHMLKTLFDFFKKAIEPRTYDIDFNTIVSIINSKHVPAQVLIECTTLNNEALRNKAIEVIEDRPDIRIKTEYIVVD